MSIKDRIIHLLGGYTEADTIQGNALFGAPFNEFREDLVDLTENHSNDGHVRIRRVRELIQKYTPKALKEK